MLDFFRINVTSFFENIKVKTIFSLFIYFVIPLYLNDKKKKELNISLNVEICQIGFT